MALFHGRNCGVYMNGVNLSGDLNTITPLSEQELADVSAFGNVGHTFYPGLAKDSLTIEALYNDTEKTAFEGMIQDETGLNMMIALGSILGDPAYCANEVMLKSNFIKSVVTDVNRATINLDVDNYPFAPATMLTAGIQSVGVASTGTGTSIDQVSSNATGGAAYLQVFTIVSGTLTVKVQTSSTGAWAGEQATTASFSAASSSEAQRVAITGTIERYVRTSWVDTGSTATFALALNRNR